MTKGKDIFTKLRAYKRKFFLNFLIKGALISCASILAIFILVNTLEHFLHFNSLVRALLLISLILSSTILIFIYLLIPAFRLYRSNTSMNDYDAAKNIGLFFPQISDKLLNIIQLSNNQGTGSSLVKAGIAQKSAAMKSVEFKDAVTLKANRRYVPYVITSLFVLLVLLLFNPQVITSSTSRIVQFNRTFEPVAPFQFNLENEKLTAFKNDDFKVTVSLAGEAIPNEAYINISGRSYKMLSVEKGLFEYTLKKLQSDKDILFEASGFQSRSYLLNVVSRPLLKTFNVYLDFPAYLNRKKERLSNIGNLQVPEGTSIRWELSTTNTNEISLSFNEKALSPTTATSDVFTFEYKAVKSTLYTLDLLNDYG